ncbi:MAG: hypothetical protein Q7U77_00960 [Sediminibacterium sp.]|uniref:glycine-rich domain-containing protein n=1 Tax=Sediminibacterium sp. TaxID=1917865 RepID=UPI0027191C65|nr:hypothetical protein [Sediminibacterium sp.]MDO8995176.1 hypothetical protein [Sediminibacterium sp.]
MEQLEESSNRNKVMLIDPFQVKSTIISNLPNDKLGWIISLIILSLIAGQYDISFLLLVAVVLALPIYFILDRCKLFKQGKQITFIKSYQFPAVIKERVRNHYPHLSDKELLLVLQGLRQYLMLCNHANGGVMSMPSRVVDGAWHEFILVTKAYSQFCQQGMGSFLHHTPSEEMDSTSILLEGMTNTWQLACAWEGINPERPAQLPFLFAVDQVLNIPNGLIHSLDNKYNYRESDQSGCGCG